MEYIKYRVRIVIINHNVGDTPSYIDYHTEARNECDAISNVIKMFNNAKRIEGDTIVDIYLL